MRSKSVNITRLWMIHISKDINLLESVQIRNKRFQLLKKLRQNWRKNSPKLLKIYMIKKIHGKDVVLRQLIINKKGIEGIVLKMSDIQKKLDHINITQLIEKELKGIYG